MASDGPTLTALAALVSIIAFINAYNRLNVISQNQGGDYQPGQWGGEQPRMGTRLDCEAS
jgi:hypothetical protein